MMLVRCLFLAFICVLAAGCSLDRVTADRAASLVAAASKTFNEEPDLAVARAAIPAHLKLLEGLLLVTPDNAGLRTTIAQGWCSYAFGFVEQSGESDAAARASELYLRGYRAGLPALGGDVAVALQRNTLTDVEGVLDSVGKGDVAPLFWSAYCLGNWVNANLASVDGVAEFPKVELMMRRVAQLEPSFYHGGADLFYGFYYGKRPKLFGGDPAKAREHLLKAEAFSQGRFLMAKLFLAELYAVAVQDEKLFEETLQQVVAAPADLMPEERLANEIARKRAQYLLARKGELFDVAEPGEAKAATTQGGEP